MIRASVLPPSVACFPSSRSLNSRLRSMRLLMALAASLGVCGLAQAQTATSTSLALSSSSVSPGTLVTLTATVTGIAANAAGTVLFCDANHMISVPTPGGTATACEDIHIVGQAQLVTSASAGLTVGNAYYRYFPGPGSHSYKAVFLGTTAYAPSNSSAAALTVSTTTGATPTVSAVTATGSYVFSATVSGSYVGPGAAPTGTVNFVNTSNPTTPTSSNIVTTATLTAAPGFTPTWPGSETTTTTGAGPTTVIAGDFNNDGIPDLAVTEYIGTANAQTVVQILLGNGSGGFTSSGSYAVGIDGAAGSQTHPVGVVTGDFNGDGYLDLAVADQAASGYISILLNNGNGTFGTATNLSAGSGAKGYNPNYMALADFNGDGILDLAVTDLGANTAADPGYVSVFLGNANGSFTYSNSYATGWQPYEVAVGDFNHDGYPDLVVANYSTSTATGNITDVISVLLNDGAGTGTFATQSELSTVVSSVSSNQKALTVGDFNGDGYPDVVVGDYNNSSSSNNILVFLNGGSSSPGLSTFTATAGTGVPLAMYTADINGDGNADIVYLSNSKGFVYQLGNGNGGFGTYVQQNPSYTGGSEQSVAVADFNGDGVPDFALTLSTGTTNGTTVGSWLGTWTGSSTATAASTTVAGTGNVTGGVYNPYIEASYQGDTHFAATIGPDTYHGDDSSTVTTTLALAASPSGGAASGQQVTLTATLSPYTTQGWLTNGDTVTFKDGSTTLGTGTLASGVATFSTTTLTGFNNTLTASFVDTVNGSTTPVFKSSSSTAFSYPIGTEPTIVFNIATHYISDPAFTVAATSNSTGALTYSLVSGPATVTSGGAVTLSGTTGTVVIQVTQAAHQPYVGATQNASFAVNAGSVWLGDSGSALSQFDLAGTAVSGSGYTGGGLGTLSGPLGVAFDGSADAWVASSAGISEFSSAGAVLLSAYTGGGISSPTSVAVDGKGYVWVANGNNSVSVLTNSGTAISPSTGYTGGSYSTPVAIGIDIAGNVWVLNQGSNSVTQIVGGAAPVAPLATSLTNKTTGARP